MSKAQEQIRVVVVSPGDVARERAVAQRAVDELNRGVASHRGCRLSLWRWEVDARPGMHLDGPQGLIDEGMRIQDADIVVGLFWKRFGTPTGSADSGSEHELRRAWAAWQDNGRPEVMVYFCSRAYSPRSSDELAQWQRVLEFQQTLPEQQLWWRYRSVASFERLLREHLTAYLLGRGALPKPRRRRSTSENGAQRPFPLPAAVSAGTRDEFVGRDADLEALAEIYARAAGGSRQLVLLSGEPGIGKTRLATECALRAHDAGAIVLYGRCDEVTLLPQQPFVEALRHYVCSCPPQVLAGQLQLISGELRRIVPELADRIPDLPEPLGGDPDGARSRLFEAGAALLCDAAQSTPVVFVLDDLHWADKVTLLLLRYLVRYPRQARLMMIGTYRETELDAGHPLVATLAELSSERLLQRRALAPLDEAAVSRLVSVHAGDRASPELRRLVFDGTEGNAFFVVEVLRDLAESGAIGGANAHQQHDIAAGRLAVPDGVKDVIAHRLARLGHQTSRLLETASVLGREFELDVLQRLSQLDEDELVNRLESAVRARVIEEVARAAGRHAFAHTLIRDTLYGGLTATHRTILHRRTAAAIEKAHHAELDPHLEELAHHFGQAGSPADLDKAIEYATRAGEHAISQLEYERAATHYRNAAELIAATDRPRLRGRHCDLVIAQGEAERQAGDPAYRQTLLSGARLAQDLHDPDRLARAALANHRSVFSSSAHGVDRDRVCVLRQALAAYDTGDCPTRAALLVLLAVELVRDDDWRLREKLSDDAVAMARRVGDLRTLALVLTQRAVAQWKPETLPHRQSDILEAGELADRLQDPLLGGHAAFLGALAAMEAGDLERCDRSLARLAAVADRLGQPLMRWYAVIARAQRCCISGHADEAERLASDALELGRSAGQPDSLLWILGSLLVARFLHGSLDRGEPSLPDLIETPGSSLQASPEITPSRSLPLAFGATMSLVLCEVGRVDDARRHFEVLMSELDPLPHNYLALAIPAYASVACARLGDKRSAIRLYAILEPHSHRFVTRGSGWLGAATHYLGLLAATLDRLDEADARFAAAEQSYIALGAEPWLARLRSDWAAALLTRRRGSDERRAEQLLERAAAYRGLASAEGGHAFAAATSRGRGAISDLRH